MAAVGKGTVISSFGTATERLMVNLSNPDPALGDLRSTLEGGPHPFLTDAAVRRALSVSIDRNLLAEVGYGAAGKATCNIVPGPAIYVSTANDECLVQDIAKANNILEAAGWQRGSDGIRAKDGVRLSILYQTSTNAVRQDTQAMVKQWWSEIGVETELRNLSASVFFGGDQSSPDTYQKHFSDIEMYTNLFSGTDPQSYLAMYLCGNEPKPESQWQGENINRYCDIAYDALHAELTRTGDMEKRYEIAKRLNDMLTKDSYTMIPLTHRGGVAAHSNSLGGVVMNSWDSELWNVSDWYRP